MKRLLQWLMLVVVIGLMTACSSNSELKEINDQGYEAYQLGNYSEAVTLLTAGIEKDDGYGDFYTNRGMAYYALGDVEKALADLNLAVTLKKEFPEAYLNRAPCIWVLAYKKKL